jgi:hypothetical protein
MQMSWRFVLGRGCGTAPRLTDEDIDYVHFIDTNPEDSDFALESRAG